jgi:hypothetical protein
MDALPQRQIRKCIESEDVAPVVLQLPPPPASKPPVSALLGKHGALEVSQQLALLDKVGCCFFFLCKWCVHSHVVSLKIFFDRIRPFPELTHQNWMKSSKRDLSPNVLAFIARFNQLFYICVTDCIAQEQTSARSARFQFWAEVHQHCVALGNFNAAVR